MNLISTLAAAGNNAAVVGILGVVFGFFLKWALPPLRGVANVELSNAEKEVQAALRELEAAKKTPGLDDDAAALRLLQAKRNAETAMRRLKAILDGIPA